MRNFVKYGSNLASKNLSASNQRDSLQSNLFETPSYTHQDFLIKKIVDNPDLQTKLTKMKYNYAESQIFNKQYNFKKEELQKMS